MKQSKPLKKRKLSLQWRLALTAAGLVTAACVLLTVLIGRSAMLQLDEIEHTAIQIQTQEGGSLTLDVAVGELFPDLQRQIRESRGQMVWQSLLAMTAVIVFSGACTYFLAGQALKPVRELSSKIETVQARNLSNPIEVPESGDELTKLSLAFNRMLDRLDQAFETQRRFSAHAAHELRTPLAVIQTDLDVLERRKSPEPAVYQETFSRVKEQLNRLSRLVNVLLEMTRSGSMERNETVSLSDVAEEVLCDLAGVAQQKQVRLEQTPGQAAATGSDLLLYRAVYNLVENAINYNKPGGLVTVSCSQDRKVVRVTVTDTGTGIPHELWEQIWEPFFRADKSRSRKMGGAGLGLAFVAQIAEEHGGRAYVAESSGEGTSICLELPAADHRQEELR